MEKRADLTGRFFRCRNIENLLLMAVLGDVSVREKARFELQRRRVIRGLDDFADSFMTNLSVV
jgi:hypothetical protein